MNITASQTVNANPNFASPTDGFIRDSFESHLRKELKTLGVIIPAVQSRTTKELAVMKEDKVIAYISRKTAIKSGQLVVCLHPRFAKLIDAAIAAETDIQIRPGRQSRYISSSNYRGFESKGWTKEIDTNEHIAVAYTVTPSADLSELKSLLQARLAY